MSFLLLYQGILCFLSKEKHQPKVIIKDNWGSFIQLVRKISRKIDISYPRHARVHVQIRG